MRGDDRTGGSRAFPVGAGGAVPARGERRPAAVTVFLVVSRFETDHALTYLFCEGAPPAARVQAFVDGRPERFRGSNAVVELGERFAGLAEARQRALGLGSWLSNVNIVFPPVRVG